MGARVSEVFAVYTFWGLPDVCQGWRIQLNIVSFCAALSVHGWVGYGILEFLLVFAAATRDKLLPDNYLLDRCHFERSSELDSQFIFHRINPITSYLETSSGIHSEKPHVIHKKLPNSNHY